MKISVIIPMYNESAVIENTAKKLSEYMSTHFDEYEILFIDDGSTDGCKDIIERAKLENVKVFGYESNHGKGYAIRHGMLEACGDIRIFTDADLAYGVQVIGEAYEYMITNDGVDILVGSRSAHKDGYAAYTPIRRIMSKMYVELLHMYGGIDIGDCQCGFKVFRAKSAEEIFSVCQTDGFSFDFEVLLRARNAGKHIFEMPIKILEHRESTVHPVRDACRMIRDIGAIKKTVKSGK